MKLRIVLKRVFSVQVFLIAAVSLTPVFGQDTDTDGVLDEEDNCVAIPNGPDLGTCVRTLSGIVTSTGIVCSDGKIGE